MAVKVVSPPPRWVPSPRPGPQIQLQFFLVSLLVNSKERKRQRQTQRQKDREDWSKGRNIIPIESFNLCFLLVREMLCFQALSCNYSLLFQRLAADLLFKIIFIASMVFIPLLALFPLASHKSWADAISRGKFTCRLLSLPWSHVCPLWIAVGQASCSEHSEVRPGTPNPEDSIRWVLLHRPSPGYLQHLQIYQQFVLKAQRELMPAAWRSQSALKLRGSNSFLLVAFCSGRLDKKGKKQFSNCLKKVG